MIENHRLTTSLRSNPATSESKLYDGFPASMRSTMFTLLGPGKIAGVPIVFTDKARETSTIIFHMGPSLAGYPGVVHGGVLAMLLDEGLATCLMRVAPGRIPVTMNLNIQFRRPAPTGELYATKARVVSMADDVVRVDGQLRY
ncbi:HotDog domain-containing protein [Aspergillus aurantiobrunneus]